jgi:hypothetical protein
MKPTYNGDPSLGCVGYYDETGYVGREETRNLSVGEIVTLDDGTRWMLNKPASCVRITSDDPMELQHWQRPD